MASAATTPAIRVSLANMPRLGLILNRRERSAAEARSHWGAPPLHPASVLPRPHICFVAPNAWPVFSHDPRIEIIGGSEVQQSILARALVVAGYRVSMICLDFGQPQRVLLDGVTVHKTYRPDAGLPVLRLDRKSTRLNSSHTVISYAVFCLKKKKKNKESRI